LTYQLAVMVPNRECGRHLAADRMR
jgi:hypothetical protein